MKKLTIDFSHGGKLYSATVNYSPATPDVYYLSNGDPGYPGDPAEMEFLTLFEVGEDGKEVGAMTLLEDSEVHDALWNEAIPEAADVYNELMQYRGE